MTRPLHPIAVLLTPPGRGAIASLLVRGPGAVQAVEALFHPAGGVAWRDTPADRIRVGRWGAATGEEVVVVLRSEGSVEINCHGGVAAPRAIIDSLLERGCTELDWQAWLAQFAPDAIAARALRALALATTERAASILWDQAAGAMRRALDELDRLAAASDDAAIQRALDNLLKYVPVGLHLVEPWTVVLAGRPNVGKSSLINALLGFERAIVHEAPGTTRDVVHAVTAFDGWPVELADTAGLRPTSDPIEAAGVGLARERLAEADLVVLIFDASQPWLPEDAALIHDWPQALAVHNKSDLPAGIGTRPPGLAASAVTGSGVDQLAAAIIARLVPRSPQPGEAVPFDRELVDDLQRMAPRLLRP